MDHILDRLTREEQQSLLSRLGSWSAFQRKLGLTTKELNKTRPYLSLDVLQTWQPYDFKQKLERVGSVELFSLIYHCKESEIRRRCEQWGIDLKLVSKPVGSKSGIGRKAELYFKNLMGDKIIEDCFETRSHTCEFDFRVEGLGLVNVKASQPRRCSSKSYKTDPYRWYFNTKGAADSDYLVLVPLDKEATPMTALMVDTKTVIQTCTGDRQIILTGKEIQKALKQQNIDSGLTGIRLQSMIELSSLNYV